VYRVFTSQINPVYEFPHIFLNIYFSIILPYAPSSYLQVFPNKSLNEFLFSPTCNVPRPFRGTSLLKKIFLNTRNIFFKFSLKVEAARPKRRNKVILLHGVMTQNIIICATTAVKGRRIIEFWIKNKDFLSHKTWTSDFVFTTPAFILIA
jgi:hypothetical protein